jgi:L-arabonate dehydrase
MEDFAYAGLQAIIRQPGEAQLLQCDALTAKAIRENASDAEVYNPEVIRPFNGPISSSGSIAVLKANLSPTGAVIQPSAAAHALRKHTGRAAVFESIEEYRCRVTPASKSTRAA